MPRAAVHSRARKGRLGAGSYAFIVTFAGDSNYNAITTPVVEPLTINKGTLTLNTTIYNAATGGDRQPARWARQVYDTATLERGYGGLHAHDRRVSYSFNSAAAGSGAQSSTEGPLGAGSYSFS